jgi:hypothetical protein
MTVQFSRAAFISENNKALEAINQAIHALEHTTGLPIELENDRLAELSRARNQRTQLEQVNAHLIAATTTISPMDEQTANELNALGNKLEEQIATNAILDATVEFVTQVLDDVNELRGIIRDHS